VTIGRAVLLVGGVFLVAVMAGLLLGGGDAGRPFSAASAPRLMNHAPPAVDADANDLTLGHPAAIPPEPAAVAPREPRTEVAAAPPRAVETPVAVDSGAGSEPKPTPTTAPVAPSPSPTSRPVRRPRPTPAPTFDDSGTGDFDFPGEP
jgi:hypothetical protein